MGNKVGKLLIAHPNLPEDNWFRKTVIYIYSDDEQYGTLGLTLNVRTSMTVSQLANQRGIDFPYQSQSLFKGGPVAETSLIMLHTDEWRGVNTTDAGPRYKLSSDNYMFERLAQGDQPAYWKMFLGLCGWKPGQLDLELAGQFPYKQENSWLIADANDYILFELDGDDAWTAAVDLSSKQMISQFF